MKLSRVLAFTIVVALAMQALDAFYHIQFGVALHVPYMLVKVIVVGWALFFVSYYSGVSASRGLLYCLACTTFFDLYYRFAEPTLDRAKFMIDERVYFILVHWVALAIPYFLTVHYLLSDADRNALRATRDSVLLKMIGWGAIVGAIFTFPSRYFLKGYNLHVGLTYNDHVLVGGLAFILMFVAAYQYLRTRSMTKDSWLVIIAVLVVLAVGYAVRPYRATPGGTALACAPVAPSTLNVIVFDSKSGFTPDELHAKVGDTVTVVNQSQSTLRVASNPHPVHTSFPEWDSDTLDPCASWTHTFTKAASFYYHDHYDPGLQGRVIVQ